MAPFSFDVRFIILRITICHWEERDSHVIPTEGETIEIRSYKHNGKLHRVWEQSAVLKSTSQEIIGGNDRILVLKVMEALGERGNLRYFIFIMKNGLM